MFHPKTPAHVAIIMDGNGRWAKKRLLPRAEGHRQGVEALNRVVESAVQLGIKRLTVFAFSSENWARPAPEVAMLMKLFAQALRRWSEPLAKAGVRLRVIGDRTAFSESVNQAIDENERATASGSNMELVIAANYGGRWDVCQATQQVLAVGLDLTPINLTKFMTVPDVDLLIRTGGNVVFRTSYFGKVPTLRYISPSVCGLTLMLRIWKTLWRGMYVVNVVLVARASNCKMASNCRCNRQY